MRKETREYLRVRHSPEEILSEYDQQFIDWIKDMEECNYSHPETVLFIRGGMAPAAGMANGIEHKLSEMRITFPLIITSSASCMTLAMAK